MPLGTGWGISEISKQKTTHMLRSTKLSLTIATTTLLCTSSLFAAPVRDFSDDHVLTNARPDASAQNRDTQSIGITLINNLDQPEALASFSNPSTTTTHRKPGTPGASDLGNNNNNSSNDIKSTVVVVPLPAPAGLALAGMLLIGSIRRR